MSAKTDNGWATVTGSADLTTIRVDTHTTKVRRGDVATILGWLVRQLHYGSIERVVSLYGWRTVAENTRAGGIRTSNHLSGTAVDYNGAKHPYEATHPKTWVSGWSASQVKAIKTLLAFLEGTVRWGLYFRTGLRDGMHFEVVGTAAQLARVARKLDGGTVHVTDAGLACRAAPSVKAKLKGRRAVGYKIVYTEVVWREGRLWLRSSSGNYYAAEFTSI